MDTQELVGFLREANKNSYANKSAVKVVSLRPASEDYHFEKDDLIYHDTYFGSRDFLGEEIVYKGDNPVWGMNYYGFVASEAVNHKDVYGFLRTALIQDYGNIIPVRGPKNFKEGGWEYHNHAKGFLNRFTGTEEIFKNNELVYRAHYHGGFIR